VATRAAVQCPQVCHSRVRFGPADRDRDAMEKEAMSDVSRQNHWEKVYTTKGENADTP
jgi:hypothetical protein